MSEDVYNFFNTNRKNNFVILIDKISNHFLTIPFDVMKKDFPLQGDNNNRYKFSISGETKQKFQYNSILLFIFIISFSNKMYVCKIGFTNMIAGGFSKLI
jgi:hypothetical protein